MKNEKFESSMRDWSADSRRAFIRSIPAPKRHTKEVMLAPGLPAHGIIGQDVSILDPRSVKSQLAGWGDFRAGWWQLNQRVHAFFNPRATLEEIMYAFHQRHHFVTLLFAQIAHDYRTIFNLILGKRSGDAVRYTVSQTRNTGVER
jgi:hypothetical protein